MTVYSTEHCPQCQFLKQKMTEKHLLFDVCTDENILTEKGIVSVPVLGLDDGTLLRFADALKYVDGM